MYNKTKANNKMRSESAFPTLPVAYDYISKTVLSYNGIRAKSINRSQERDHMHAQLSADPLTVYLPQLYHTSLIN